MNVAKWLLLAILAWPVVELAAFVAVASAIGFAPAVLLQLAISCVGVMILRYGGGMHIARARVAMTSGSFTTVQSDGAGFFTLIGGILLLIPGFITDAIGAILVIHPLRRLLGDMVAGRDRRREDVIDLERGEWRRVPEEQLADRRNKGAQH